MPELKNTFTGGRMDKDQDERILDSKSYREALNIEVFTTEDSDIGSAQNILGNIQVTKAIQGPSYDYSNCNVVSIVDNEKKPGFRYAGTNKHIAHAVDPQSDKLYRFINTEPTAENPHGVWMDRIVEYDTNANIQDPWYVKEKSVMVDIYKVATTIAGIEDPPPPPPPPPPPADEPDPEDPCDWYEYDPSSMFYNPSLSSYTQFQCAPVPGASCRNKWAYNVATSIAYNPVTQQVEPDAWDIDIRNYVVRCQNNERGVYGGPQGGNKIWKGTGWSVRPYSTGNHIVQPGGAEGAALYAYVNSAAFTSSTTQEIWYRWGKTGGVWYDKGQTLPNGISISQLNYFAGGYNGGTPGITFFVYRELLDFLENWLNIPNASTLSGTMAQPNQLNNIINQGSYNGNPLTNGRIIVKANRLELA